MAYTLPAKIMEYFPFQRIFFNLWCMKGISLFQKRSYEQIYIFWGANSRLTAKWTAKLENYDFGLFFVLDSV